MSIARLMQMARAGVPAGDVWTDPDLANASYDSVSFSVAGQDAAPRDLSFKPDGTKLYVLGIAADDVFEYDLSTAWDISTATYTASVSVGGASYGMYFRPDGEKFYIMDIGGTVYQWSVSSAWDVTTATYDSVSFSVTGQDTSPRDVVFNDDGTKMFIVGAYNDKIYQYSLSSAWDISSASYDTVEFSVISQDSSPLGIVFNPDGTKFWIYGFSNQSVFEYSLSSAWDLSTASYSSISFSTAAQLSAGFGLAFSSSGDKMYISANTGDTIYQYSTVTPAAPSWTDPDLANASYDSVSFSVATEEAAPTGLFIKPDGSKFYIVGANGDEVNEYDLSSAWDISTASYVQNFSVASQDTAPTGLFFKDDGLKMYVMGSSGDAVNEYDLSTAWDVSTASYLQNFSVSAQDVTPRELFFKPDGTKMYFIGLSDDEVHEYNLSAAWDVSTASYVQSFSVAAQELTCTGLFFSPAGTTFFVMGVSGDDVNEYSLSTAWDISTASYVQNFSVASQETTPTSVFFKSDGSKMYIVGTANDTIYQYSTD